MGNADQTARGITKSTQLFKISRNVLPKMKYPYLPCRFSDLSFSLDWRPRRSAHR